MRVQTNVIEDVGHEAVEIGELLDDVLTIVDKHLL